MTSTPASAAGAARGLWSRVAGNDRAVEAATAAAEHTCAELRSTLGRWIGSEGYAALLDRALSLVRAKHPVLDGLSFVRGVRPGAAETDAPEHGADEIATAIVALVTTLIELLGRIIGQDLTIRLVEQIDHPNPREVVSIETGGHDD